LPPDAGSGAAALPGAGGFDLLGGSNPAIAAGDLPLPENQAFRFEAIVDTADRLLLRFTPAPGYYLYRERNSVELEAEGVSAGAIQWPHSQPHFDEHFGNVEVYFDPVDAPLPLLREHTRAVPAVLRVTFQGCQTDG